MNTKHTPYKLLQMPDGDFEVRNSINVLIACFCEDQMEEACFLAAAPDMYLELKKTLDWLIHIKPQVQALDSVMMGFDQAIKAHRAAIAKAKGELS